MRVKWKDMPVTHKIARVVLGSVSVLALVFIGLDEFNVIDAFNIWIALLGVSNLCKAYLEWNEKRTIAYLCIGAAIIAFISFFVILFI